MDAKRKVVKWKDTTSASSFTVLGISSHENDYRLSWSFNQHFGFSFVHSENLVSGSGNEFTCFSHNGDDKNLALISNRCDNGFLLDKYKKIDFILKFDILLNETELAEWLRNLKKAPFVLATMHIPVNKQILKLLDA